MTTEKRIYSAGPSITEKEVRYAAEAARDGWYSRYNEWVENFETAFADYIGVKHAHATPHGTSALHLAMCALELAEGDEVIVPDISWVATANAILYTGAKPVFVDVTPDSWTMDPEGLKKAITKRTKAIMPVHLYGHPAEMDEVGQVARDHGLIIVEDACPAVGSEYKGKKAGNLGDIGCFSFQGAKLLATGEGGMLVTDNSEYFERVRLLSEHARDDSEKTFWCVELGFQYSMANVVAAIGLAQLERVDELVAMKRQIFDWYHERLKVLEGVSMFKEKPGILSNCSYPSIILDEGSSVGRDELRTKLKEKNIDSRPAFPRMSQFPHLEDAHTPVAEKVEKRGLNLPCPFNLTEEDADYVCRMIEDILRGTN
jgi:perosamine synthetase